MPTGQLTKHNHLKGEFIPCDKHITSNNKSYRCVMQNDGNLVLYRCSDGKALWASGTNGSGGVRVVMQKDGNLVVYDAQGKACWASGTNGHQDSFVVMQDDGNLVIYNTAGRPVWASNTCQSVTYSQPRQVEQAPRQVQTVVRRG